MKHAPLHFSGLSIKQHQIHALVGWGVELMSGALFFVFYMWPKKFLRETGHNERNRHCQ